ncbi:hypothetical protein TanjilG_10647 [Lupinus angustifolius]|uniref:Uncharacterized protein n=1 Tax=Lupinus angustifolius TaxID=3871 RepID=A0A394DFZ3_LUPAN|nr:hypothetical protein TanjilG_10647 [Lupinus angustifolius]
MHLPKTKKVSVDGRGRGEEERMEEGVDRGVVKEGVDRGVDRELRNGELGI